MSQFGHSDPKLDGAFGPPPPWRAEQPLWRRGWFLAVFFVLVLAGIILLLSSLFGGRNTLVERNAPQQPVPRQQVQNPPEVVASEGEVSNPTAGTGICRATDAAVRNTLLETLKGGVTPVVDSTVENAAGAPAPIVAMSVVLPNGRVAVGVWFAPPAGPVRAYDKVAQRASTAPAAKHRERLDLLSAQARDCVPGF